jgi:hypothetical protein
VERYADPSPSPLSLLNFTLVQETLFDNAGEEREINVDEMSEEREDLPKS